MCHQNGDTSVTANPCQWNQIFTTKVRIICKVYEYMVICDLLLISCSMNQPRLSTSISHNQNSATRVFVWKLNQHLYRSAKHPKLQRNRGEHFKQYSELYIQSAILATCFPESTLVVQTIRHSGPASDVCLAQPCLSTIPSTRRCISLHFKKSARESFIPKWKLARKRHATWLNVLVCSTSHTFGLNTESGAWQHQGLVPFAVPHYPSHPSR